jgi:hypothetical protein
VLFFAAAAGGTPAARPVDNDAVSASSRYIDTVIEHLDEGDESETSVRPETLCVKASSGM